MRLWKEIAPATTLADTLRISICNQHTLPLKEINATIWWEDGEVPCFSPWVVLMRVWTLNGCTLKFYTPVLLMLSFEVTHFKRSDFFPSITALYFPRQKLPFNIWRIWFLENERQVAEGASQKKAASWVVSVCKAKHGEWGQKRPGVVAQGELQHAPMWKDNDLETEENFLHMENVKINSQLQTSQMVKCYGHSF